MADTVETIINYLAARLTGDATLAALFPGGAVRLFLEYAPPDGLDTLVAGIKTKQPYLVHSFSAGEMTPYGVRTATYSVSVWDEAAQSQRALRIRGRVLDLLSRMGFSTAAGEACAVRLSPPVDQAVPDTEPDIWRRDLVFSARYFDVQEAASITSH